MGNMVAQKINHLNKPSIKIQLIKNNINKNNKIKIKFNNNFIVKIKCFLI